MRRNYRMYRRTHFPFSYFWIGFILMMVFGWKLLFLFPLLMMLRFWGSWGRSYRAYDWHEAEMDKPKGKPKNDDWDIDYV